MSKNTNRDYLIIVDAKTSTIRELNKLEFYINDKESHNIFVQLVIKESHDVINKYAPIDDPNLYELAMNIVKPTNEHKRITGDLISLEDGLYEFKLPQDCCDKVGTYICELETIYNSRITNSNRIKYRIKKSVLNDLDDIVDAPGYPIVIQLLEKLSDIEQYEEDRRANELARQLAEEQRQTRFDTLDADITDRIETIDNKLVEIDNVLISKEDIADIKAKNTEQDRRLDVAENRLDNINTNIENVLQPTVQRVDAIEAINTAQNDRLDAIEVKNTQQDNRLDATENRLANIGNDITNTMQPIIDGHTSRLEAIEAIDVAQNNRLDAIEAKNQQQDDRLLDIEKVNNRQDIDIKCLYGASQTIDITKEGNSIYLQNSNNGFVAIDEIKGNTLVNCNKEPDKEIILNGNINTRGYGNVTLTEGVDGGLVDVALEGNTMVNVCDQKDPVAITKSYIVETGNHVALQGEYDGKCRPVVTGNTLWIDNNTEEVLTAFDESKNLRLQSSFEDKVVTQEMVDAGEELAENLGKYKVDYVISREDGTVGFTKTFYLNSPLLEGDTIEQQGNNVVHVHRYGKVVLDGSEYGWTKEYEKENTIDFYNINCIPNRLTATHTSMSPNFPYSSESMSTYDSECIKNSTGFLFNINKTRLTSLDVNGFKLWLQSNPQPIIYRLNSPTYEVISQNDTILCDSYVNGHLDVDSVVPIEKVDFLPFTDELTYLYTSTQYAVQFVSDAVNKVDITLGGAKLLNQNVVVGTNKYTITTPSTLVDNKLVVNGVGLNIEKVVVTQATDQDFGYFEGMKSVGECEDLEVVSKNRNLYNPNKNNLIRYGYFNSDGTLQPDNNYVYTNEYTDISCLRGKKLYIAVTENGVLSNTFAYLRFVLYDICKNVIMFKRSPGSGEGACIVPENAKYIRFSFGADISNLPKLIVLVTEDVNRTYELHQSNIQQLTHEPLRAVGDVKDKYVLIDGKWHIERNCAEVVLDGSEDESWRLEKQTDTHIKYQLSVFKNKINKPDSGLKCNAFKHITIAESDKCNIEGIADGYNSLYAIIVVLSKSRNILNKNDFKTWLSNNNLTVVYKLSTPTYEPIDYSPFTVYSDITHITTNSTIPANMTIKNTGYNCLLKPSTTYTVSSNLGLNLVTTPSTLTEDCLRFYDTDTSDVTTMKNVMVLEGDYTTGKPLPSHFSGIESAFEQEYDEGKGKYKVKVKVVGKNLFNGNWYDGWLNNGNIVLSNSYKYCDYIRVPSNAKIKVKCSFDIAEYDYNKNFIKNNGGGRTTIITNSNCYYIRICVKKSQDISNYQIEQGTETTEYEPYKENYIEFYIDEPLRGIGDVKDKVYVKDDKVVVQRNCGQRVYQDGDFGTYLTDKVNTVYQLAEPTYEEVEYNDVKLFIGSFKNSTLFYNSNIPVTSKLYYSYSVPIVDTVAQTADISNQQDSMIIDLATQVAVMEMMLM